MFRQLRAEIADVYKERRLIRDAWRAEQAGRSETAKEFLVQLTLLRLRKEFEVNAKQTKRLLGLKTGSGVYEQEYVEFSKPINGYNVSAGILSLQAEYHSCVIRPDTPIANTEEGRKISQVVGGHGLRVGFNYSNSSFESQLREIERTHLAGSKLHSITRPSFIKLRVTR